MKRDLDLIRRILLEIEALPPGQSLDSIKYPEYEELTIHKHVDLLDQAGLIEAIIKKVKPTNRVVKFMITGLTWKGHDFLDLVKNDSIWNKAKEKFLKPGVSFSFEILFEWLKMKAKEKIGLS